MFPLKAADFIARGVAKGPALGAALRAAEEAWIAQDFPMDAAALAKIAEAAAAAGVNDLPKIAPDFRRRVAIRLSSVREPTPAAPKR